MKILPCIIVAAIAVLSASCGTYRYYQPSFNAALFRDKGELHLSGNVGSSGATLKAAVSISDKIGMVALYNGGILEYRPREFELGAGYIVPGKAFFLAGLGFGSNFEYTDSTHTAKSYRGDFYRPFLQVNGGVTGGTIFKGVKGDLIAVFKANYFSYKGRHLDGTNDPINSGYLTLEPGLMVGLGSRIFRFDFTVGMPFRPAFVGLSSRSEARTFPASAAAGISFVFGRKR